MNDDKGLAALSDFVQETKQDGGWNYRVFRIQYGDETVYEMREAYFKDVLYKDTLDAANLGYSDAQPMVEYSLDGMRQALLSMLGALDKPILDLQGDGDNPHAPQRALNGNMVLLETVSAGKITHLGGHEPDVFVELNTDGILLVRNDFTGGRSFSFAASREIVQRLGKYLFEDIEIALVLRQKRV